MKSVFSLLLFVIVCAQYPGVSNSEIRGKAVINDPSGINAPAQRQSFINVDGPNLKARMDEAIRQARSRNERFWIAYSFDVRPGVAVDMNMSGFSGTIGDYSGTSVMIGTSNGVTVETRNLAVFLLHEPGGRQVSRMEIYNLEREREYSGYGVYFLGRAGNQESLDHLQSLVASNSADKLAERATLAIGLHDDRRVGTILKDLIRNAANTKVKHSAIFWLGHIGGEQNFLADLVRSERESVDTRKRAASALGRSREATALAVLENLYGSVAEREVKHAIISSAARSENQSGAVRFLSKIAKNDSDHESRKYAISRLGRLPGAISLLSDLVRNERESLDIRSAAVSSLRRSDDAGVIATLDELYRSVSDQKIRREIVSAISRTEKPDEAAEFLLKVIRNDSDFEMRKEAVSRLGRVNCQRCVQSLAEIVNSSASDARLQIEAVRAMSRSSQDEVVPLLIYIARTHSDADVRKEVIRRLRYKKDERVQEFLKELITK